MPSGADGRRPFWLVIAVVIVLDRITKFLAVRHFSDRPVHVIGETLQFRLVYNQAAAFGLSLGSLQRWLFIAIALVAIVWLWNAARHAPATDLLRQYSVAFVAGGAAGNVIDRLLSGRGVVDFIDVGINTLRWPTFNVADMAVTCGAVALAISLWREDARRATTQATPVSAP